MAALPSPSQVAGDHVGLYESYFTSLERQGTIPAVDAAKFLKRSGLPDSMLSRIWDLSDPNAKGYLNKAGFFTAMKLMSLAQLGHEVSIANTVMNLPPPNLGGPIPSRGPTPTINSVAVTPVTLNDWAMKPTERAKYEQLFESLQPLNGVIPGNKVKGLLIDSKLPVHTLGKIWDLADMDKDGSLDKHEFIVAMHLVYKALEKYAIPDSLPPELLPPDKRKDVKLPIVTHSIPAQPAPGVPPAQSIIVNGGGGLTWVVTPEEKAKYDELFLQTDVDKDGFVSGREIKDVFLRSGIRQPVLAVIWGLCDMKQLGKLNAEQFALANWMIQQKLKGIDPPSSLTPNMIPPSMRNQVNTTATTSIYSNPELDMITKDIEELMREKQILEGEVIQREAEIKIKTGEAKSLQGELDTLVATLKQLENQKGEAGRRLNDLKNQVDKLRKDAEEQEALVKSQEEELSSKKKELENLKIEESSLEQRQNELHKKLQNLSDSLQQSQLSISQAKTKIEDIQEHQRQLKEAIEVVDKALASNDISVSNNYLELEPEFRDPSYARLINPKETEDTPVHKPPSEPTKPSKSDFFTDDAFRNDPFAASSAFTPAFPEPSSKLPFGNDPFSSFPTDSGPRSDPFDPFGNSKPAHHKTSNDGNEDAFGCEPFGAPALPPKNKQPPPRPAPPRPAPPPPHVANANDSFADFSAFSNKSQETSKLDFTEDPFKDYRYEDTFNIDDPFDDSDNVLPNSGNNGIQDPFSPTKPGGMNPKFKNCDQILSDNMNKFDSPSKIEQEKDSNQSSLLSRLNA